MPRPADLVLGLIAAAGLAFLAWQGFLLFCVRYSERSRKEFEQAFPGRCHICAHHAYGQREFGIDCDKVPFDHRCPERMERWRGFLHKRAS